MWWVDHMATSQIPSNGEVEGTAVATVDDLVDEMLGSYIDWRRDAAAVAHAYRRWREAPAAEAARRFCACMTALDREEAAATTYALIVTEVEHALRRAHRGD
jgi:hypothetical protein